MKGDDKAETTIRSEEELIVERDRQARGSLGIHKRVETFTAETEVPRRVEYYDDLERGDPLDDDSAEVEVLEDGSVSIPVLEEELVISRRLVVRERVILRKVTETEVERIRAELRRERIEIDDRDGLLADDVPEKTDTEEGTR